MPALRGFAFARCCGSSWLPSHTPSERSGSGLARFQPRAVAYDSWLPPVGIRDLHPPPFIHARRTQSPYGLLPIPPRSLSLPTYSCVDPPPPSTLISRGEVSHRGWHRGVGGEPFEIFFLLVRSEKFICLSSFATVLRLTRMPKAESSAAIFFVVLRVHLRPLTGSPATSYFISSSIAAMTSGVFFRQLCGRHPLFGPAPHSHHAQVAHDGPGATVLTSSPRISAIWRSPP